MPLTVLFTVLNECFLAPYGLVKAHSTGNWFFRNKHCCQCFSGSAAASQAPSNFCCHGGSVLCCSPACLLWCPVQTGHCFSHAHTCGRMMAVFPPWRQSFIYNIIIDMFGLKSTIFLLVPSCLCPFSPL